MIVDMTEEEYRDDVRQKVDALMATVNKMGTADGLINIEALLDATALMVAWHLDQMTKDEQDTALAKLGDAIVDALYPPEIPVNADGETIQ